ncbi:hypothetical protein ES703_24077 [subsurface metagenome]
MGNTHREFALKVLSEAYAPDVQDEALEIELRGT